MRDIYEPAGGAVHTHAYLIYGTGDNIHPHHKVMKSNSKSARELVKFLTEEL